MRYISASVLDYDAGKRDFFQFYSHLSPGTRSFDYTDFFLVSIIIALPVTEVIS